MKQLSKRLNCTVIAGFGLIACLKAQAQNGPSYEYGDVIAVFENSAGNDVELNLGSLQSMLSAGVVDFGNVSSLLQSTGQSVASTHFSIAAALTGYIREDSVTILQAPLGQISALPNTLIFGQNNSAIPSFVGSSSSLSSGPNYAIEGVGMDISKNPALGSTGLAADGVSVSAMFDGSSYTSSENYDGLSNNLETNGAGSLAVWLVTSETPGTTGKEATDEGPFTGAYDLGLFTLSSSGELVGTFIPEPSADALSFGLLGFSVAVAAKYSRWRRDKSRVILRIADSV